MENTISFLGLLRGTSATHIPKPLDLSQFAQVAQHGWNEFRWSRMNVHCAMQGGIGAS
jgi:hypothetical protein